MEEELYRIHRVSIHLKNILDHDTVLRKNSIDKDKNGAIDEEEISYLRNLSYDNDNKKLITQNDLNSFILIANQLTSKENLGTNVVNMNIFYRKYFPGTPVDEVTVEHPASYFLGKNASRNTKL